jgi:hypothetical protein
VNFMAILYALPGICASHPIGTKPSKQSTSRGQGSPTIGPPGRLFAGEKVHLVPTPRSWNDAMFQMMDVVRQKESPGERDVVEVAKHGGISEQPFMVAMPAQTMKANRMSPAGLGHENAHAPVPTSPRKKHIRENLPVPAPPSGAKEPDALPPFVIRRRCRASPIGRSHPYLGIRWEGGPDAVEALPKRFSDIFFLQRHGYPKCDIRTQPGVRQNESGNSIVRNALDSKVEDVPKKRKPAFVFLE